MAPSDRQGKESVHFHSTWRACLGAISLAGAIALAPVGVAYADGLSDLAAFVQDAHSGRAAFTQVVTSPPKANGVANEKRSSGTFAFARPGEFRFDYRKPFEQTIVANGRTLWFYDVDLNQVTERAQAPALAQTPAAILTTAGSMQALEQDYRFADAPDRDGMQWVQVTPKVGGGQVQRIDVGFKDGTFAALDILDAFGQRSALRFSGVETNVTLPPEIFQFKVPSGVDVLRE